MNAVRRRRGAYISAVFVFVCVEDEEEEEEENAQKGEERSEGYKDNWGLGKWMGGRNGKVVYTIFASLEEWIWMVADDRD